MISFADSFLSVPRPPSVELDLEQQAPKRLNIALPNFFKNYAFGGIISALELARELSRGYEAVRFISLAPLGQAVEMFPFPSYVNGIKESVTIASLSPDNELTCHAREVFFCTYWPTVQIWQAYAQALQQAGRPVPDFYYFIQDYEPGFYPFGTHHSLAQNTYTHVEHTHALFNAAELASFFSKKRISFKTSYTLLPSLHPLMHARLQSLGHMLPPKPSDRLTIVLYGRPHTARNCFEAAICGLHQFFAPMNDSERAQYEIVSAGLEHDDIELAPGAVVTSVGKLSLEEYMSLLERAHVGISLMASPHPSYPPLEMAIFGLQVITNSYECKDLSRNHPNIWSLSLPDPTELSQTLGLAVASAQEHGSKPQEARLPSNMSPKSWRENIRKLRIKLIDCPE